MENIKNNKMEMFELEDFKNKLKNSLDRLQNKMEMTEVRVIEHEDWSVDISLNSEGKKEKSWQEPRGLVEPQQKVQHSFHQTPRKRKGAELENIFEIIRAENSPNLAKT